MDSEKLCDEVLVAIRRIVRAQHADQIIASIDEITLPPT